MLFVSTNNDEGGKGGEQHKHSKSCAHGNEFRKNTRKKFSGKGADGIKHKECSVKTSFHIVGNIGLGCGNADIIGSYAEYSDEKTSCMHNTERNVEIESFNNGN